MPGTTRFTGHSFEDIDGDSTQGAGEPDLAGLGYQIRSFSGATLTTGVTDAGGAFDVTIDTPEEITFVQVFGNIDYAALGPSDIPFFTPGGGHGHVIVRFQKIECTRVVSRWVHKVCWDPNEGVRVTYRQRGGFFTCIYPGTTHQDYLDFVNAPSKGRWAHAYYRWRPYIAVAPLP